MMGVEEKVKRNCYIYDRIGSLHEAVHKLRNSREGGRDLLFHTVSGHFEPWSVLKKKLREIVISTIGYPIICW